MPTPHPVSPWAGAQRVRAPQDEPSTSRITIAGAATVAFLGIVSLGLLLLGGWAVYAAVTGRHLEPATTPVRVIGGVIGVVLALAGLAGVTTTGELLMSRGQSLVIDARGIRRKRLKGWSLEWAQIEAVSLTVGESILVRGQGGAKVPARCCGSGWCRARRHRGCVRTRAARHTPIGTDCRWPDRCTPTSFRRSTPHCGRTRAGVIAALRPSEVTYTKVRHPAWWYLTELPQGRNAARVGELFQVRGVSFICLNAVQPARWLTMAQPGSAVTTTWEPGHSAAASATRAAMAGSGAAYA